MATRVEQLTFPGTTARGNNTFLLLGARVQQHPTLSYSPDLTDRD
jgi:hypothetical protein